MANSSRHLYASLARFVQLAALSTATAAFANTGESQPPLTTAVPAGAELSEVRDPEIVVTGSRIVGGGFQAPTPVTVLGSDDLAKAGVSSVGQIMNQLPAVRATTSPAQSTLSSQNAGGAIFDLRGLGTVRTLLLVNGRRFVPTTTSATIDSNVIPSTLIDRVEVVTGGASAAYGSDAVSGVINLILKKNIDGLVGTLQSGVSTYGDNADYLGSLGWGTAFSGGRGHFSVAVEGEQNKGITSQLARAWAARAPGFISNPSYTATNGQYKYVIANDFQLANATTGGLITSGNLKGTQFLSGGTTSSFITGQYSSAYQIGGGGVNAGDYVSLNVPHKRYTLYSNGDYDFGQITAFYEGSYSYSDGKNPNLLYPFNFSNITIQKDNAYLPASVASAMTSSSFTMGRLNTDFKPISADDSNRTTRLVGGFKGDIGAALQWNVYGEYGHTFYHSMLANNIITANFKNSVDAVTNSAGVIVCRANLAAITAPGCVPVNLFGSGSVLNTPGAASYFSGTTDYRVKIDERVGSGSLQGHLFNIGGKPVVMVAGVEYRSESIAGTSDAISQATGWLVGNPQPEKGSYDIKEAFGEIEVPLLHDLPFARSLGVNGAVRITDYSTSGTVVTWKAGAVWQINDDVRLRFTRSRDIRAPNFDELYTNALYRFATVTDPANNNQQVTVNAITQGGKNLTPEIGNTISGGLVLTPSFISGLRASIDYYNIKIRNAITTLAAQDSLNRCYAGNTSLCALLTRNGAGTLTAISLQYVNLSKLSTRGLDFEIAYRLPLARLGLSSASTLTFRGLSTYVDELIFNDGVTSVDRAGDVGTGHSGVPHWKFNASVTYDNGPLSIFVQNRFVGGGKYDVTYSPTDLNNNRVRGRDYVDASVFLTVLDGGKQKVQLSLNVTNLFDRDPPADPLNSFSPTATNPILYDVIGRQVSAGVHFKF